MLWWSWSGYAWLTSLVDPEEGVVRIAMFGAMAAFLVAALCVPEAFGDSALIFAVAYAGVRAAHIVLFVIGSRDDPNLRASVIALAISTAIGVGLLVGGVVRGRRRCRARCGRSRSCSTTAGRTSSASRAGA